jgi:hypothetical protein
MLEAEMRKLEHLCAGFSALTEENKVFALDISQQLLVLQGPVPRSQTPPGFAESRDQRAAYGV